VTDSGQKIGEFVYVYAGTYEQLEDIARLLGVGVEEALDYVIRDASYVYNSEALDG